MTWRCSSRRVPTSRHSITHENTYRQTCTNRDAAGKGAVGVVKLVRHRVSGQQYALKCIDKEAVSRRKQQRAVLTERQMLLQCYHPCLVQFIKSFKDDSHVYFLQEYLGGGDLFYAIRQIGTRKCKQRENSLQSVGAWCVCVCVCVGILTKPQAQFYIGAIVSHSREAHM